MRHKKNATFKKITTFSSVSATIYFSIIPEHYILKVFAVPTNDFH